MWVTLNVAHRHTKKRVQTTHTHTHISITSFRAKRKVLLDFWFAWKLIETIYSRNLYHQRWKNEEKKKKISNAQCCHHLMTDKMFLSTLDYICTYVGCTHVYMYMCTCSAYSMVKKNWLWPDSIKTIFTTTVASWLKLFRNGCRFTTKEY